MDITSVLVVVLLTATLCVSDEISLTCPDTARRELKDISRIYNCKPSFVPKEEVAICDGVLQDIEVDIYVTLTFKMLKEVPEGTAICLGLQNYFVNLMAQDNIYYSLMAYSFDFNPSLAVGILRADHNTTKTNRSCSISLLSDVLNLDILSDFRPWTSSFWNFSSPLFGSKLNWIQSLSTSGSVEEMQLIWLERLQNTSIQLLNVTNMVEQKNETILLKDMPFLRQMIFNYAFVAEFHPDSFLGMPEMEVLILKRSNLSGIPQIIDRMPKLKILEISFCECESNFTIPTKELSTLKNLQVLNLKYNLIYSISGKLPPFSELKVLCLDGCHLSSIEESDFVGYPMLENLTLSNNLMTYFKENTFRPLKRLKVLDLSENKLTNWPVLYDCSLILLNVSQNLLSHLYNLGNTRTTVEFLNISYNRISEWEDKYVFSLHNAFISYADKLSKANLIHSANSNQKNITSGSTKNNAFFKSLRSSTNQKAESTIPSFSELQKEIIPVNLSLVNLYEQNEFLSNSKIGEKITANDFENAHEYRDLMQSLLWVKKIDISNNLISAFSETMIKYLDGILEVDLGGNHFDCVDCRMIPFQKWLNTTSSTVSNLGTSDPLLCSSPVTRIGTPVNLVQYDEEPCLEKVRTTSLLIVIGVPIGAISIVVVAAAGGLYNYRAEIVYMLHLYKIRRRAMAFSQSVFNKYAFDAFICYSSNDRRFVIKRLAPLLEKGKEQYCVCLHERDFPLGSHIVSNIVGSIQHSRKTIIVLSEHFIKSKWCQWELEMANHKMFNEDEHFLILIQLETLDRNSLPRHLQFLMDTRTYLEWPSSPGKNDEEELVVQRLRTALGPSIFQTTNERAPLLSDVMEDY